MNFEEQQDVNSFDNTPTNEELEILIQISTSLEWIFASLFILIGLFIVQLFFIGKGDKG